MTEIDWKESKTAGDMTNSETHVNVIIDPPSNLKVPSGSIAITSGDLPARVPKNNTTKRNRTFKRWNVMSFAKSRARQKQWDSQKAKQRKLDLKGNY